MTDKNPERITEERRQRWRKNALFTQAHYRAPGRTVIDLADVGALKRATGSISTLCDNLMNAKPDEAEDMDWLQIHDLFLEVAEYTENVKQLTYRLDGIAENLTAARELAEELDADDLEELRSYQNIKPRPVSWGADPADD